MRAAAGLLSSPTSLINHNRRPLGAVFASSVLVTGVPRSVRRSARVSGRRFATRTKSTAKSGIRASGERAIALQLRSCREVRNDRIFEHDLAL